MKVVRRNMKLYFADEMLSDCIISITAENGCFLNSETRGPTLPLDAEITEPPRIGGCKDSVPL